MIVVVIAGTLLAIAIPSYIDKVRTSRRVEAKTALLDLAGREERFYNTNNTYSLTPSDLGYGAVAAIVSDGGRQQLLQRQRHQYIRRLCRTAVVAPLIRLRPPPSTISSRTRSARPSRSPTLVCRPPHPTPPNAGSALSRRKA